MGSGGIAGVRGVHVVRACRPGKPIRWFVYAWRGGPCVLKATGPGRPRLDATTIAAIAAAQAEDRRPDPAVFRAIVHDWRTSADWSALAPGTRRVWRGQLDLIEAHWGKTPTAFWSDARMTPKIVAWRDTRAATPRSADIGVTVLRTMLDFARLRGWVSINVAANIPTLYRGGDRADIVWTAADIAAFGASADALGVFGMRDLIELAALTGLRRQDLVTLRWDQVRSHAIVKRALKRSAGKRQTATVPRLPALDALLDRLRTVHRADGVQTLLVNSRGRSWTGDGAGGSFNRVRDAANGGAGIVHIEDDDDGKPVARAKHLHDVRGTFCTNLILSGLTDDQVAERMAWSATRVSTIRRTYVDDARVVVAIGEQMRDAFVKRTVKQ